MLILGTPTPVYYLRELSCVNHQHNFNLDFVPHDIHGSHGKKKEKSQGFSKNEFV